MTTTTTPVRKSPPPEERPTAFTPTRLTERQKKLVRSVAARLYDGIPLWELSCGVLRASYQSQLRDDPPWRAWLGNCLFHAVLLADAGDPEPLARLEEDVLPRVLSTRLLPIQLAAFVEEAALAQLVTPAHRQYLEMAFEYTGQLHL